MKKFLNNVKKKLTKIWNSDPKDILVPIVSFLILIISTFSIGIIKGIVLFIIINCIYFLPSYILKKRGTKKVTSKKKNTKPERKVSNSSKKVVTKKKPKKKKKKVLKILLLIFLTCFILGIVAAIMFFSYIVKNAPEFDESLLYITDPTIVLDKNGKEIAKLGAEKRVTITYDQLPEVLVDAIVATEDSRFFEHNGVDWARFLKASFYQLLGKPAGGASTLTMQVSKNHYTNTEAEGIEGIIRKFTDVYVSMFKIEKNYTKEQIIEFYVNDPYLGNSAYGVEQISLTYFGKSTKDLNLAEAAMIAGLFQAPGRYNPYKNPEATEARRQTVLKLMLRHGYISQDEYNIAKKMTVEKIVIPKEENKNAVSEISPYQSFIDTVVEEVQDKTGKNPYTTSMIIETTLDTDIQDYINGIMDGSSYNWENDKVQAGIAVINVKDGSVSALGGNRNINAIDTFNYATDIENQIGSAAKPLYDYGPAIEYNNWNSYHILVDEPITYSDGTKINNWNMAFEGFETMRIALKGSRNIPALKAFKANNKAKIIEFTTNLGLTPEIYSCKDGYKRDKKLCINKENPNDVIAANKASTLHEAHAIGGYNGESPLSMAAAYSAFARGGNYVKPYTFTKLTYQDTKEEFINDIEKTKAMSEETAYIISDMLATTATQAVGGYYNINGIRYAAKTGTTNYDDAAMRAHNMPGNAVNDLWTIGFNTEYTIGVWYGYDSISNEYYNVLSSGQHNRLFQAVGKKVFTNKDYFKQPTGVVSIEVESGCPEATLPSEFTPADLRQTELFIKGTEPTTVSTRFAKLSDVNNLKATSVDDKITLTWDAVKTPEINTESYLKNYFSKVFENQGYLNGFVADRLSYNSAHIGNLGYNVYRKDSNGTLTLLDFVTTNKYDAKISESGEYTFVVKTAYSIFKSNMSDGKQVSASITVNDPLIPTDPDEGNNGDDDDDNTDDNNNNDNKPNQNNTRN